MLLFRPLRLWLLLLVRARGSFAYVFRKQLRCMYQVCCLLCRRHRPPKVGRLVFVCFPGCRLDLLMPQELVQACKGGGREQHHQYQRQCETEALELVASTVQCKGLQEVSRLPMSSTAQVVGQVCFIWAIAVGRCSWCFFFARSSWQGKASRWAEWLLNGVLFAAAS